MKAPKVRLYIRIRRADGTDACADPAWNRNRSLRAGYATVAGRLESHPEGVFYLRYARGGKRLWESIGTDPDLAITALRNVEHDLHAVVLGRTPALVSSAVAPAKESPPVEDAIAAYMTEVRAFKAQKTISACEHMLGEFAKTCGGKDVQRVTRADLLSHMTTLRQQGLGDRTIFNHIGRVNTLLKANDVVHLLRPSDWPRFDEREVDAYHAEELSKLLSTASLKDRLLFGVLHGHRLQGAGSHVLHLGQCRL